MFYKKSISRWRPILFISSATQSYNIYDLLIWNIDSPFSGSLSYWRDHGNVVDGNPLIFPAELFLGAFCVELILKESLHPKGWYPELPPVNFL